MPTMIFHAPYPLDRNAKAASGIRPVRLRDAFEELGYEVLDVTGTGSERRRRIRALRQRLRAGQRIDFLYSESATIPTMLTEPRHLPPHPLLDVDLFRLCARHRVPTGLFYRDVYWAFPEYDEQVSAPIALAMRSLYRYDLAWYSKWVDRLFLPSMEMGEFVPVYPKDRMRALPPGGTPSDVARPSLQDGVLTLVYVGGLGAHYRLHEAVKAVAGRSDTRLVMCVPEAQWQANVGEYAPLMADNVEVVHASGDALEHLYAKADCGVLFVDPIDYRGFAAPVKLFEYIAHAVPVLTAGGTLASHIVTEAGLGWAADYSAQALGRLLDDLHAHPEVFADTAAHMRDAREQHTWLARARAAAEELTAVHQ
ncbi:glycosyl transferase family 1 [Schaalia sp. 19OD2882]|uniref:glycosyl transferase family 1 n=1 Tax=Schaalia sp. 19OD2882 TaxID=2794089 RepID=UPI001C1F1794|nr:glycosyl transferase family 1 [Schaalia sp. 19OD2882]QWW20276.1 glycosyl transferase family 1 [Schaalia sp. 19OD2882]